MTAEEKFRIISEGQQLGITQTCNKYNISRTLYYRWLNKYKSLGFRGLEITTSNFVPVNKTTPQITSSCLNLIKNYPLLGPREIKYLLEKVNIKISESAVYNIMKRHHLSTRDARLRFSKRRERITPFVEQQSKPLASTNTWLCWINDYGHFEQLGTIYEFTIYDYTSHLACSRLYPQPNLHNFIDLFTAVAIPISQSLNMVVDNLVFLDTIKHVNKADEKILNELLELLKNHNFEVNLYSHPIPTSMDDFETIRHLYTQKCLGYLMPHIYQKLTFFELRRKLQTFIRDYNMSIPLLHGESDISPIDHYVKSKSMSIVLPLWAYIDRDYN